MEHITITGLEFNINYTVSIVASACNTVSHAVTTYILIEENGQLDVCGFHSVHEKVLSYIINSYRRHNNSFITSNYCGSIYFKLVPACIN